MDYKEKLRLAKEALESGSYDKDTIEYIFPELYESEDDVIRKAILELVKQSSEILDKQNQNNMINWLEKQGEKKSQRMVSAEAKEALYDKPTDEEMKELLRTEYEKGRADTIAEMEKDWSEKDEKVIAIINNALTESNTPPDDYDKVYDWLESLRKRIGE